MSASVGQNGEHAVAFLLLGLAFGLAHARNRWLTAALVIGFTGLIELLQLAVPGRHARMSDFIVGLLAASLGIAATAGFDRLRGRGQQSMR